MAQPMDYIDFGGGTAKTVSTNREVLAADLANIGNNVLATVLSFNGVAGYTYRFSFVAAYTAAATTTGSRWTVSASGTPTKISYMSQWNISTDGTTTPLFTAFYTTKELPAAASASSMTTGNIVRIDGFITPSATGAVAIQNASEVTSSAITCLAGATLEWALVD